MNLNWEHSLVLVAYYLMKCGRIDGIYPISFVNNSTVFNREVMFSVLTVLVHVKRLSICRYVFKIKMSTNIKIEDVVCATLKQPVFRNTKKH